MNISPGTPSGMVVRWSSGQRSLLSRGPLRVRQVTWLPTHVGQPDQPELQTCSGSMAWWVQGSTLWVQPTDKGRNRQNKPHWNVPRNIHKYQTRLLLICRGYVISCDLFHSFNYILQGCFTGTGAIIWLTQCQWSNPEGCGSYPNQNITQQSANHVRNAAVHLLMLITRSNV